MPGILSRARRERIAPLELGGGNGAPLDVGGTHVLRLEWGHARALSSRAEAAVSCLPSHGSRDKGLSLEAFPKAFPRGFPTGLSHVPPWCESILGLKVDAVQGNQVSLEWTETSGVSGSGGTTLEFLSPCMWKAPPLEMRWVRRKFFPEHAGKGSLRSS